VHDVLVCTAFQIYSTKKAFNERLIGLRDKKLHIVSEISDLVQELEQVQSVLGPDMSEPLPEVPTMHPCETPEK